MSFISTGGEAVPTDLRGAVFRGLPPDGGLYMPRAFPILGEEALEDLRRRPWPTLAADVLEQLAPDALPGTALRTLTSAALDFPVPLVHLGGRVFVLELFHGPTLAFKDFGARFLARLMAHYRAVGDPVTTVLTATSGDTGGAVAQAFHGLDGIRALVLFPDGKVTPRQERQFSTLGGNVTAIAVQGDFDDCQRLAKEAFRMAARNRPGGPGEAGARPVPEAPTLTSANSINIGRFLPQTTYFFRLWQELSKTAGNRTKILVSVPSGNFGNLAAGLLARAMGLSGLTFLAATNENDVVPEFLQTGVFKPRPSIPTLSTAMDVGDPSNLARIRYLYGNDVRAIRGDVVGQRVTDRATREVIRRMWEEQGYLMDPHTAVGMVALERELVRRPRSLGVLLATAHPAKFAEVVEPLIGEPVPIPPELARCLDAERAVVPMEPRQEDLQELLRAPPPGSDGFRPAR